MLDRLKSLPLTAFLTILIWMYAEAQVHSVARETAEVRGIPVRVSAAPDVLARYDVDVQPTTVDVTVSGAAPAIDAVKKNTAAGVKDIGIYAFLDVASDDTAGEAFSPRRLRYVMPDGLKLDFGPQDVKFRLRDRGTGRGQ